MKKLITILLATAMMLFVVACTNTEQNNESSVTSTSNNKNSDTVNTPSNETANATSDEEESGFQLDYNPFFPNKTTMVGFGTEWNIESLNMNFNEFKNGTDFGRVKLYGENDNVASFLICEYTYYDAALNMKWTGANIMLALCMSLTDEEIYNDALWSENPEDWLPIFAESACIFETEKAFYRFDAINQDTYNETFELFILPKENKQVTVDDNLIIWHGINVIVNLSGEEFMQLEAPSTVLSESDYSYIQTVLFETWGVDIPNYERLCIIDKEAHVQE